MKLADGLDSDCGHIKTQILLRLADFHNYASRFGQWSSQQPRLIGVLMISRIGSVNDRSIRLASSAWGVRSALVLMLTMTACHEEQKAAPQAVLCVLPSQNDSTPGCARRPLHCGISIRPMSANGAARLLRRRAADDGASASLHGVGRVEAIEERGPIEKLLVQVHVLHDASQFVEVLAADHRVVFFMVVAFFMVVVTRP